MARLLLVAVLALTQEYLLGLNASASGVTPALTKCLIEVHDAHISTYLRHTFGKMG